MKKNLIGKKFYHRIFIDAGFINLEPRVVLFEFIYQNKMQEKSLFFHLVQTAACKRGEVFKLRMKGFQGKQALHFAEKIRGDFKRLV